VRVERKWKNEDTVTLNLPMAISVQRWPANHDSVSVNYGPLTFSLKIGERVERVDSSKTAMGDSGWQKTADPMQWPSFGYYPTTPWNYGLVLDEAHPEASFMVEKLPWPQNDFPFTPESTPSRWLRPARKFRNGPWINTDYVRCCSPVPSAVNNLRNR